MFNVNQTYTKKQIYELLNVPNEKRKGNWDTGYRQYDGNFYIFANIGIPGRTGHDYINYWDGELLHWEAKSETHSLMPSIKKLLSNDPAQKIFVFTRTDDKSPFTYEGIGKVQSTSGERPVKVVWRFDDEANYEDNSPETPGQVISDKYWEGGVIEILVNKYERDRGARRECINHYGAKCLVCEMEFEMRYGELGKGFIHVHHVVALFSVDERYLVDPVKDLVPVCPNCHSMLHKKNPAYTVSELRALIATLLPAST